MKLLNKIFTGIICGALLTNGVMAADDCSNTAYKQAHPERCKYDAKSGNSYTYLTLGAGIAAAGAALAALAGGGGGSSSGDATVASSSANYYSRVITPTAITRTSVGSDINIDELETAISSNSYNRNATQYDEIQLAYSIARGYNGAGTTIAVFDENFKTYYSHGTVVKTVAQDIASGANITSNQISFTSNTGNMNEIYTEIGNKIAETNGIDVYNNSWNASITADTVHTRSQLANLTSQTFVNAVSNAATQNDAIFVWAAGNDSSAQSGLLSSMPLVMPELNGHFVNVVAWDSNTSSLADYSNACGVTKDYCITAPGTLYTARPTNPDKITVHNGTSFAAPVVSAAIAIIREAEMEKNHPMDAATITQILFETATDLGEKGVDEIYGHGMLDMEAATRPVGTPTIVISDNVSQPLQIARVSVQIAQGIKSANPTMAFFDKYGREFKTNVADNISAQNRGLGFERMRGDDARMKIDMGDIEFGFYRNDMLSGTGFLQTDGDTTTTYIATNKSYNLGNFELFGRTQMGVARPRVSSESMISEFSNIYTASAYVGVRGEKWSLSVGIPDTIVDGTMQLHLASGRNSTGAIAYRDYAIDMTGAPAVEYTANYRFLTAGFVDNPYGKNEFYMFAKTKFAF